MAGTAVKLAVLMIMVASVCFDACQACGVCGTPTVPVYKPPMPPKLPKPPKMPKMPKPPPKAPTCPVPLSQLGVCSPLLGGILGSLLPASNGCCELLGLLGVDVEICLCLALDANILGLISVNAKVDAVVSILTTCGYKVPPNFSCPL